MYNVVYVKVTKYGKIRESRTFSTRESAINFYKSNLRDMAYGYISDDEAMETADEVMGMYEEELKEREAEMTELLDNHLWF